MYMYDPQGYRISFYTPVTYNNGYYYHQQKPTGFSISKIYMKWFTGLLGIRT